MSAMLGGALAVSFPASQVEQLTLPGSVFAWGDIADASLAPELRVALRLVMHAAEARGATVRFIARPEIFTHGVSRAWLDAKLDGTTHHLALTDGQALRLLPGLANHMFFYARGITAAEEALRRLVGRAPELFEQLESQVNGALSFRIGQRDVQPEQQWLRFDRTPAIELPRLAPLILRSGDPGRSGELAAAAALPSAEAPAAEAPLHYIPLSEAALADEAFLAEIAQLAQRAPMHTPAELPVLGLPPCATPDAPLADRLAGVFRSLAASGLVFSRTPSWNLRFATEPPAAAAMAGGRITLHPSTAFWRFGQDIFAAAKVVDVAGGASAEPFRALLGKWLGFDPVLRRSAAEAARLSVTLGAAQ
jgi:hypothetical protein